MAKQLWCCDYCDFQDESRSRVERHEEKCDANPVNKADDPCDDCHKAGSEYCASACPVNH